MSDCLFCKIIRKEIPAKIEYEDEEVLAFHDINAQAPAHLLVVPKKHFSQISDLEEKDAHLAGILLVRAKKIAQSKKWTDYRLVINNGPEAGQSVFHIHVHLLSGRRMTWPPG